MRPGTTSSRPSEVAAEARYDSAFTFIFSPRPGTAAAEMGDRFVPHDVAVDRYERLRRVIERSSRLANEARIGQGRGGRRGGAEQEGPVGHLRPHPPQHARALSVAAWACAPARNLRPSVEVTEPPRPTSCRARLVAMSSHGASAGWRRATSGRRRIPVAVATRADPHEPTEPAIRKTGEPGDGGTGRLWRCGHASAAMLSPLSTLRRRPSMGERARRCSVQTGALAALNAGGVVGSASASVAEGPP